MSERFLKIMKRTIILLMVKIFVNNLNCLCNDGRDIFYLLKQKSGINLYPQKCTKNLHHIQKFNQSM